MTDARISNVFSRIMKAFAASLSSSTCGCCCCCCCCWAAVAGPPEAASVARSIERSRSKGSKAFNLGSRSKRSKNINRSKSNNTIGIIPAALQNSQSFKPKQNMKQHKQHQVRRKGICNRRRGCGCNLIRSKTPVVTTAGTYLARSLESSG